MRTYRFKFVWFGTNMNQWYVAFKDNVRVLLLSLEILQDPDSQCSIWECPKFKAPTKLKCWFLIMYIGLWAYTCPSWAKTFQIQLVCVMGPFIAWRVMAISKIWLLVNQALYFTLHIEQSTLQTLRSNIATPQRSNAPRLHIYTLHFTLYTQHTPHSALHTQHPRFSIILHTSPY